MTTKVAINEKKKRPCIVPICRGGRFDLVHKFPMEPERTAKWLDALQIPGLWKVPLEKLRTSYFICSRHFHKQDYKNTISRHLNKTAVPSLNLKSLENVEITSDEIIVPVPDHVVRNALNIQQLPPSPSLVRRNLNISKKTEDEEINIGQKRYFTTEPLPCKEEPFIKSKPMGEFILKNSNTQRSADILNSLAFLADSECRKKGAIHEEVTNCTDEEVVEVAIPISCEQFNQEDYKEEVDEDEIAEDDLENLGMATNFVEVNHPDFSELLTIDNFWLRDHCRCDHCYNFETKQRKYDLLSIPMDTKPLVTEVRDGKLYVKWDDGHESTYDFDFLYEAQISHLKKSDNGAISKILWSGKEVPQLQFSRVNFCDLISNENEAKEIVKSLVKFGFAFIEGVPAKQDITEFAIRSLFPIQKTFFGEMWSFTDKPDHSDTAYSKEYLGPHTDNTYFCDAAGLQIFHCVKHNGSGGETLLLDGFKVIEDLRKRNSRAFEKLCKVNISAEYIESDEQHHIYSAPIIKMNSIRNEPEQIRFNLYDRAVFNTIPQTEMFEFYSDFRELIKLINNEENIWTFKLNPGTVLIFDNWRILHGRRSYTGIREITGCYVSRTDFMSKARIYGFVK